MGNLEEALRNARESVAAVDRNAGEPTFQEAMNRTLLLAREGWILGWDNGPSLGRYVEAREVLERAFRIADEFVHKDPHDEASRSRLALAGLPLGDMLRQTDPHRALDFYDHTHRHMNEVRNQGLQSMEVSLLSGSTYVLRRLGRRAEARGRLDRAFVILQALQLYPAKTVEAGSETDLALSALAAHEADTGHSARAIELYQGLLDRLAAGGVKPENSLDASVNWSRILQSMSLVYRRASRPAEASAIHAQRVGLWQEWNRKLPGNPFVLRQLAKAVSN
jgi:tetratricopeptide (TPR) repeat protein